MATKLGSTSPFTSSNNISSHIPGNPHQIVTSRKHWVSSTNSVTIAGVTEGGAPTIIGSHTATRIDDTHFSIPVDTTGQTYSGGTYTTPHTAYSTVDAAFAASTTQDAIVVWGGVDTSYGIVQHQIQTAGGIPTSSISGKTLWVYLKNATILSETNGYIFQTTAPGANNTMIYFRGLGYYKNQARKFLELTTGTYTGCLFDFENVLFDATTTAAATSTYAFWSEYPIKFHKCGIVVKGATSISDTYIIVLEQTGSNGSSFTNTWFRNTTGEYALIGYASGRTGTLTDCVIDGLTDPSTAHSLTMARLTLINSSSTSNLSNYVQPGSYNVVDLTRHNYQVTSSLSDGAMERNLRRAADNPGGNTSLGRGPDQPWWNPANRAYIYHGYQMKDAYTASNASGLWNNDTYCWELAYDAANSAVTITRDSDAQATPVTMEISNAPALALVEHVSDADGSNRVVDLTNTTGSLRRQFEFGFDTSQPVSAPTITLGDTVTTGNANYVKDIITLRYNGV